MQDRRVGGLARIETQLLQQSANADPGALMANADAHRAIFVVDAHGNYGMLKARVTNAGHCQQQLPGQETRTLHALQNAPWAKGLQAL
jgi:hypothetical protein